VRVSPESVAEQKQQRRAEDSSREKPGGVFNKVGKNHQGDAEKHRSPDIQALSIDESDEPDRAEDQSAHEVRETQRWQHGL
jgi:hypothetical protein